MLELFGMQIRHMLGGKRKWLVAVCLVLPVLLTMSAVATGGLGQVRRELEAERARMAWASGEIPATAQRVTWQGEDLSFAGGSLTLSRDGLRWHGRPVRLSRVIVVNEGYIVVRDGELWVDPTKESRHPGWRIHVVHRSRSGSPEQVAVPDVATIGAIYLFLLYPQAVCLLLALFYGTSVLGDELDGKTLTYLFTRPLPRWHFVVGKYLGIVSALALPTALSLLASWIIAGAPGGWSLFAATLVGAVGALLAYNALFVLFGFVLPRRAMIAALLYGIVFELILSFVPALVNELTITYYLRSLVVDILDLELPREAARAVGGATAPVALLALACITVGSLAAASLLAARREYVVKDTA